MPCRNESQCKPGLQTRFHLALVLLLALSLPAQAERYLTELSPPFDQCANQVRGNPNEVIEQMEVLQDSELSQTQVAQRRYCLSLAYLTLVYPVKAIDQIELALQQISVQSQPWLYHKLQIVNAEAREANGEASKALELTNDAVAWSVSNRNEQIEMHALRARGLIKTSLRDYLGALQDLNRAYSIASTVSDAAKINIGSYLGLVYEYRDEYALAIPYFQQAVNFYRGSGEDGELSISLYGLGYAYSKRGNFSLARETLQESLRISENIEDKQGAAYAIKELAYINLQQENLPLAQRQIAEAGRLSKTSENPYLAISINQLSAELSIAKGDISAAERANDIARELVDMDSMPVIYLELEQQKASLLAGRGYYKAAFENISSILKQKLMIMREQSSSQLLQIRAQYELETKEKENRHLQAINTAAAAELKTQRSRNILLLLMLTSAGVICALLAYIVVRNREIQKKLEDMANLDALTGVANRRRAMELIENQLNLARRHNFPLAVCIIDLDNFKLINDTYGHPVGDRVLEAFGLVLKKSMRNTDILGRIGGEEFILALPHTTTETAFHVLDQLRLKTHKVPDLINDHRITVSFSCGLCDAQKSANLSDLLSQADTALYLAKQKGRDCIVVAGGDIEESSHAIRQSVTELD